MFDTPDMSTQESLIAFVNKVQEHKKLNTLSAQEMYYLQTVEEANKQVDDMIGGERDLTEGMNYYFPHFQNIYVTLDIHYIFLFWYILKSCDADPRHRI